MSRDENRIVVAGRLQESDFRRIFAVIHKAVNDTGYQDLVLDFSELTSAYPSSVLPICSHVRELSRNRIDFDLVLPNDEKLKRIFVNANWAHLICPRKHEEYSKRRGAQIPATVFESSESQQNVVNSFVQTLLSTVSGLTRPELSAVEWALNEITDNVLNHAQSATGGLVQLSVLNKSNQLIEIAVCDAGLGIPATLRTTRKIDTDLDALDLAIREGVTRDLAVGQGNGLFGTFEICRKSGGYLRIESGNALLTYSEAGGLRMRNNPIPYHGTLIDARISLSGSDLLADALRFRGQMHTPVDILELKYESDSGSLLNYRLIDEVKSFGSRQAAKPVRVQIENILTMCPDSKLRIDFSDIPIVSSSFADEVFGRLFVALGPMAFMGRIEFTAVNPTVRSLIDAAIARRVATTLMGA